jgi:hypothetical protein
MQAMKQRARKHRDLVAKKTRLFFRTTQRFVVALLDIVTRHQVSFCAARA